MLSNNRGPVFSVPRASDLSQVFAACKTEAFSLSESWKYNLAAGDLLKLAFDFIVSLSSWPGSRELGVAFLSSSF